ncbi:MAG: hypothetical protein CMJ48_01550 [Planctomycetaceae bacterium]|nr:hypothetical protein [Planctomycetaceae bacterium]
MMNNTWKPFANAFLLMVATGIIWGFAVAITLESVIEITRGVRSSKYIVIRQDGTPFVQITKFGRSYDYEVTYETLGGERAPRGLTGR